jgi:hypothetical protein
LKGDHLWTIPAYLALNLLSGFSGEDIQINFCETQHNLHILGRIAVVTANRNLFN